MCAVLCACVLWCPCVVAGGRGERGHGPGSPFSAPGVPGTRTDLPSRSGSGFRRRRALLCCDGWAREGLDASFLRRWISVTFSDGNAYGEMHHGCCARTPHFIRQGQGGENTSRRTPWIPIRHRPGPMLRSLHCMCVHLGRLPLTKTAGPTLPLACTRYPVPEWDVATGSGSGRTGVRGSGLGRDLIHRSQAPPPASPQHPSPGTAHRPPQPTPTHYQAHPPGTPTRHHQAHTTPRRPTTRSCGRPDWRSRGGWAPASCSGSVVPEERCPCLSVPSPRAMPHKGRGQGRGQYYYRGPPPTRSSPFPPSLPQSSISSFSISFGATHFFLACLLDPSLSFFLFFYSPSKRSLF